MTNEYTIGSYFTGIMGLEEGFAEVGFEPIWFIEKEPFCQAIIRREHPGKPIYNDVTKVKYRELQRPWAVAGGFPCQDISISQTTNPTGIEGKRSGLWKYYFKGIRILRPEVAIIENVSEISNRGLNVVIADLTKVRYECVWFDLRASDFGLPHKRERIFIIAYSKQGRIQRLFQKITSKLPGINEKVSRGDMGFRYNQLPEPAFLGTGHGIPQRVDRCKAIGNAVCPPVARFIAENIKEVEEEINATVGA